MKDDVLRDLLTDAVDGVDPRYGLGEIRARTRTAKPRWPYAAGGALLAFAASVAAFALMPSFEGPQAVDPGSNTSTSPSPTSSASTSASATPVPFDVVAVYYVGDTPDGPRLYREFRPVPSADKLGNAVAEVVNGMPLDADYSSGWPQAEDTFIGASVVADVIRVEVGDPAVLVDYDYPAGVPEMAIQQVIYTAQAALQERLPVQFVYQGNPAAEVLGVPTSEPLANGPALDTLALVSLTTPTEGMVVDNDEPFVVEGAGNSFEGTIVTRFEDASGGEVLEPQPVIAGWMEERLFPFRLTLDLSAVPPGEYVVTSQTDDPSGDQRWHSDTRNITVVE